jgi:hypothetical protein
MEMQEGNTQADEKTPSPAKSLDDYGKKAWKGPDKTRSRKGEYIGSIVANLIFLLIVNKVPDWNLSFITESYPSVLWAVNLSIFVQIVGNALLIFFDPRWLRHLANLAFNIFGVISIAVVYAIYPFNFAVFGMEWYDVAAKIMLLIALFATAIAGAVHGVQFVVSLATAEDR